MTTTDVLPHDEASPPEQGASNPPLVPERAWPIITAVLAIALGLGLAHRAWTLHSGYQTSGFDLGIFAQGTWLLAHFESPFVTIRGLNLFGDHASYILALVAPFYRLWPDPRLLLMLQVVTLILPSLAVYRLGARHVSRMAGCAAAVAYLLYPAMQWPAVWQFHPETLAAGFLAMVVLTYDSRSYRWMTLWLALAMLCKEDVSFVVFGFGLVVLLNGHRWLAGKIMAAAFLYFASVTFVITPLINGQGSLYFQRNYGIEGSGLGLVLQAAPVLLWNAIKKALTDDGILYLSLVFGPMAMLPLLGGRWLLPVAGPLLLNLASTVPYQQQITFQYLATSAPFLAFAMVMALKRLKTYEFNLAPVLVVLVVVAGALSFTKGPITEIWEGRHLSASDYPSYTAALDVIPKGAAVSAEYDLDTHLVDRNNVYEFPNPFHVANWGITGDDPISQERQDSVEYVIVNRANLGETDKGVLAQLEASGEWTNVFEQNDVVVLHRSRS